MRFLWPANVPRFASDPFAVCSVPPARLLLELEFPGFGGDADPSRIGSDAAGRDDCGEEPSSAVTLRPAPGLRFHAGAPNAWPPDPVIRPLVRRLPDACRVAGRMR